MPEPFAVPSIVNIVTALSGESTTGAEEKFSGGDDGFKNEGKRITVRMLFGVVAGGYAVHDTSSLSLLQGVTIPTSRYCHGPS
jgi:hypothetical protein